MRLLWDNEIDKHTLGPFSEHSSYPVENLQDYQLAKKYRSVVFTDLIDRGDCESETHPMIFDETVPLLTNATFARDIGEAHAGTYSYKVTKTIASGTSASIVLCDNQNTDDMHGMQAGHTYTKSMWIKVPAASGIALNEIYLIIRDYDSDWQDTEVIPTAFDVWQKLTVTRTIRAGATGANIRFHLSSSAEDTEYFYVDDIELHEAEWVGLDAGEGKTITASCASIVGHNLTSAGTFKIQGNDTNVWTDPTVNETFVYAAGIMTAYFTSDDLRFWRFLFIDPANPNEYIEIGRLTLGGYLQVDMHSRDFSILYDDGSTVDDSPSGQSFGDERIIARIYSFLFPYWEDDKRKEVVLMVRGIKKVKPIVFVPDEDNTDKMDVVYCRLNDNISVNHIVNFSWNGVLAFREVF